MKLFEGLSVTLSEADSALVAERLEAHNNEIKEGVRNDAEFLKTIKSAEAGRIYGSLERVVGRKFADLDMEKYSELSGVKKFEQAISDGLASLETSKNNTSKEWQDKYIKSQAEMKRVLEEELPTRLQSERESFYQRFIGDEILKDSLDFETVCANDARVPLVNAFFTKNGYVTKWNNDEGKYEVQTADGVRVTKDDKVLSNKDIIKEAFEFNGVLVKNNGKPEEGKHPGEHSKKPSGKLSENAQRMLDTTNVG